VGSHQLFHRNNCRVGRYAAATAQLSTRTADLFLSQPFYIYYYYNSVHVYHKAAHWYMVLYQSIPLCSPEQVAGSQLLPKTTRKIPKIPVTIITNLIKLIAQKNNSYFETDEVV